MKGWEAIKALSEGKCVRLPDSLYYFKMVQTIGNMNTVVLIDSRNMQENACYISESHLMSDNWEIYEETHDFFWAMRQVQKGKKVKRKYWVAPAHMSLKGFTNTTNYLCNSGEDFLSAADISAKDWILA